MVKKILKIPLKICFYLLVWVITYIGGLFVRRPSEPEPDTTWETGRERIYNKGIDYWEKHLEELGVKKEGINVLEVGSGNGQWLIAFSRFANKVCGVEPDKRILNYSLKKIKEFSQKEKVEKIEVKRGYAEDIPYPDESFDVVFCVGVFMFTKQEKALEEFYRVLKPRGLLVLTINGLGYFIMSLLNGMRYFSRKKTAYGLLGILNTLIKWWTGKQLGTCAVSHSEMKKKLGSKGFILTKACLWLAMDLYPLEHLGFVTNYVFIAVKDEK